MHDSSFNPSDQLRNLIINLQRCQTSLVERSVTIIVRVFALLASLMGNILRTTAFITIREPIRLLLIANMSTSELLLAVLLIPQSLTTFLGKSSI